MQVNAAGTLELEIKQTTGTGGAGSPLDVDFALYGPFSSVTDGCGAIMSGVRPIQCSYSLDSIEHPSTRTGIR